ncbi:MAG TPA: membrane protein insertion efficiency factor YidD [Ilumatobacteraceae bacterium]|nr:membrane protein insertion efficiency factor YidD [Ilumatobacteraceae bacterium]
MLAGGPVSHRRSAHRRTTIVSRTGVRSAPARGLSSRLISLVKTYQLAFQGRPSPCRFTPSCSSYAVEALAVHGTARGLWLTIRRFVRCRPFGPSGYEPVPEGKKMTS